MSSDSKDQKEGINSEDPKKGINSEDLKKGSIIGEIADNLGAVFRHLLPGVLIIGAARITHPSWFLGFNSSSWPFLAVAGTVAIAAGNAWFTVNRYIIHQAIDYIFWRRGYQGPAKGGQEGHREDGYLDHLAKYVGRPKQTETFRTAPGSTWDSVLHQSCSYIRSLSCRSSRLSGVSPTRSRRAAYRESCCFSLASSCLSVLYGRTPSPGGSMLPSCIRISCSKEHLSTRKGGFVSDQPAREQN